MSLRDLLIQIGFKIDTGEISKLETRLRDTSATAGKLANQVADSVSRTIGGLGAGLRDVGASVSGIGKAIIPLNDGLKGTNTIQKEIATAFSAIHQQAKLLGPSFDAAKEKADVLKETIKRITKEKDGANHAELPWLKKAFDAFSGSGAGAVESAMKKIATELQVIDQRALVFGESFDVAKEKADALHAAIKSMTADGVPADNKHLKNLVNQHESVTRTSALRDVGTKVLSLGVGSMVQDALKASAEHFGEFQNTMQQAGARMLASGPQIKQMRDQILGSAGELNQNPRDLANIDLELSNRGLKPHQVMDLMPTVSKLSRVGGIDTSTSADLLETTQRSYFKGDTKNSGSIADVFAKAHLSGGLSFTDLAATQKVAAPAFAAMGQSFETQMAMTTMLGKMGIKGEAAGNVLKNLLAKMATPGSFGLKQMGLDHLAKDGNNVFKTLGIDTTDKKTGSMRPMTDVMQEFFAKTQGKLDSNSHQFGPWKPGASPMEQGETRSKFFASLAGVENVSEVSGLSKISPTTLKDIKQDVGGGSIGTLDHMVGILEQGVIPAWERMSTKAEVFADLIIRNVAPSVEMFLNGLGFLIEMGSGLIQWFESLSENVAGVSEAFSFIKILFESLGVAALVVVFASLAVALGAMVGVASVLLAPLMTIIGVITAVSAAALLLWDAVSWMSGGDSNLGGIWDYLAIKIREFFPIFDETIGFWDGLFMTMENIASAALSPITMPIQGIIDAISSLLGMAARLPAVISMFQNAMELGKGFMGWGPNPQAGSGFGGVGINSFTQHFHFMNGGDHQAVSASAQGGAIAGVNMATNRTLR